MEVPYPPKVEVVINGRGEARPAKDGVLRPLSIDEALQYSPFTTSITSGHERIPMPEVKLTRPSSTLTTLNERRTTRLALEQLGNTSSRSGSRLESLQSIRHNLDMLLDGEALSEFKFKVPRNASPKPHSTGNGPPHGFTPTLSPLAKMVLDSTDIAYSYQDPSTFSTTQHSIASLPTPALSTSPERTSEKQNGFSFVSNSIPPTLRQSNATPVNSAPVVLIPTLPSGSQRADYESRPESPKRRKLDSDFQNERIALHIRAQKEEADAAVVKFQKLLSEIFETQDQLEPDTSGTIAVAERPFFEVNHHGEDNELCLSTKIHSKLQNAIRKLFDYSNFQEISIDHIKRLQRLCEPSLHAVQVMNLSFSGAAEDLDEWQDSIRRAENGITAACTLIWTMIASHSSKQLCPEYTIQSLPIILANVFDACLIPIVESRSASNNQELFRCASSNKEILSRLLHQAKKMLDLFTRFCAQMDGVETAINATEFLATKLIFVENAASEKDSVLGFQAFETVRKTAMEAIARIFARFPEQRPYIMDEILVSLEKLPSTNRAARQFRVIDGKNIQLLSALIVQLVQASSSIPRETLSHRKLDAPINHSTDAEKEESEPDEDITLVNMQQGRDSNEGKSVLRVFVETVTKLHDNATRSAQYIVNYFVQRAMTSTKTGDQPYRNLLDLFVEDLLSILSSTDWPASELLLRVLAVHMVRIVKDDKGAATAKNMALELLGWMGTSISKLRASIMDLATLVNDDESIIGRSLETFAAEHLRGSVRAQERLAIDGPWRMALEHLHARTVGNAMLSSAQGFFAVQWAKMICQTFKFEDLDDLDDQLTTEREELASFLYHVLTDQSWLAREREFETVTASQGRLSYTLNVLDLGFCQMFDVIVVVLLASITSDQAKIRSRSLKSVMIMLEIDPSILDRDPAILRAIFRCASDQSPMVRDSALSLVAKCMSLKPALEEDACRAILGCASDPTVGVRKRSISLLKDIYLRNATAELQAIIGKTLLERSLDHEESVAGLGYQTLLDLWITPLLGVLSLGNESAKVQVSLSEYASMIVKTVSQGPEELSKRLETFAKKVLKNGAKNISNISDLFRGIVASLFEWIISAQEGHSRIERESVLLTLTAFAKVDARLIASEQLKGLQPYIANLVTNDDLLFFRSVVAIYRVCLPHLSSSQQQLLFDIQNDLFKTVSKLPRTELNEVMACLATIDGVLKNTERLVKLTLSVLKGISQAKLPNGSANVLPDSLEQPATLNRLRSYVRIAGSVGKHCNLESFENTFRQAFPEWPGGSTAGLIADLIYPLTAASQPLHLRQMALESLGALCQSWPGQFNKAKIREAFAEVFSDSSAELQGNVLGTFAEFLGVREGGRDPAVGGIVDDKVEDSSRLGGSLMASDHDGAAALIAQHFLDAIINVSVSRQGSNALTAIKIIASINRQGLVHPKQCAGALVALETSPNPAISDVAFESHKLMHQQHETMFEREYMRAIAEAFSYQKDVIRDSMGATTHPFKPKLGRLFEIVKTSNSKYVKKFLSNLVTRVSISTGKLDSAEFAQNQLFLARFIVQNIAFLEYGRMDELFHVILHLENSVGQSGSELAQAIERQLTPMTNGKVEDESANFAPSTESIGQPEGVPIISQRVNVDEMKPLVVGSMIFCMLWETRVHLKRQYGIFQNVRNFTTKSSDAKELAKPPTKVHGVNGDKYWDNINAIMASLDSNEAMISRCNEFMNLMNIDNEVRVAADDDMRNNFSASVDPEDGRTVTPSDDHILRPGKRKSTASTSSTPQKKRGRPSLKGKQAPSINFRDEDDDWDGS